jgi:hypothetical protein
VTGLALVAKILPAMGNPYDMTAERFHAVLSSVAEVERMTARHV